ncbi:Protein kinase-like (PK-like) [Echinococcus multilocularis]|uniref:Protein kinase-like (PK-like) n=1 Tax=Echinococcus multilocularis TaxID=6211 RepID=A0A0S4MKW9_ECHMU|nr:Protein kinase-like (PK-like) [Echinococcus multilocularis]
MRKTSPNFGQNSGATRHRPLYGWARGEKQCSDEEGRDIELLLLSVERSGQLARGESRCERSLAIDP